ncbi:NiFeSe hydrogenase maturation protease [Desulfamplus magnetovallimortis]|nr:NiFeSe hydrogenase maturation protease [Desulfamplus magnetovallimortis]
MKKLLVLGVGNILMMDEGIGVHALHELLKEKDQWPDESIDLVDGGTFTQDIFYLFVEYEKILVLDIVKGGNTPGTIYRLTESDLRQNEKQTLSLHDIDLLDSLGMAKMISGKAPELHVLGIEPEKINWDMKLTPTLETIFPEYVKLARQEINTLLSN